MSSSAVTKNDRPIVAGLLLAAGAGRRYGGPKALAETDGVAWVRRSADVLAEGGCDLVLVVVGAEADRVADAVPTDCGVVEATDWDEGMAASLRVGLTTLTDEAVGRPEVDAVLVHLVDLPDVGAGVVARLLEQVDSGRARDVVARASYSRRAGHPVLLGRDHWQGVVDSARGDVGARNYLRERDVRLVECGDIGSGRDIDTP